MAFKLPFQKETDKNRQTLLNFVRDHCTNEELVQIAFPHYSNLERSTRQTLDPFLLNTFRNQAVALNEQENAQRKQKKLKKIRDTALIMAGGALLVTAHHQPNVDQNTTDLMTPPAVTAPTPAINPTRVTDPLDATRHITNTPDALTPDQESILDDERTLN